jgi:hypothetical protein
MEPVLYWNEVAIEANRLSFTNLGPGGSIEQNGPTLGSRALGIIHLAMHDAYVGISRTSSFGFYLQNPPLPPPITGTPTIRHSHSAIIGAAYTALVSLYPSQVTFFNTKLNAITCLNISDPAFEYGCTVAREIVQLRANDPGNSDEGYTPHAGRGKHKSDPDNAQGYLGPYYGTAEQFATTSRHPLSNAPFSSGGRFDPAKTNYVRALRQVREKGIAIDQIGSLPAGANTRTPEETLIGIFWGYDGANRIGTPPRLYNQIVRIVAMNNNDLRNYANFPGDHTDPNDCDFDSAKNFANLTERNVRLFALVNTAMADSGILAWEQKYEHNLWRPVNGIREHDVSMGSTGNANTPLNDDCDPMWLPLGAPRSNNDGTKNFTPDFPAYPSGHATFGASALHMTRLFFGIPLGDRNRDDLFDGCFFVSDEFNGVTTDNNNTIRPVHKRQFADGLWQMIIENGLSRVFLGVHWSFDAFDTCERNQPIFDRNIGGADQGISIAEDIFQNGLHQF